LLFVKDCKKNFVKVLFSKKIIITESLILEEFLCWIFGISLRRFGTTRKWQFVVVLQIHGL